MHVIFNAHFCITTLKTLDINKQICLLENYIDIQQSTGKHLYEKHNVLQMTDLELLITVIYLVRKLYDKKFVLITSKNFTVMKHIF